eukprot:Selendium_serpulae@DN8093_c0_g1_i1.p1
MNSKARVHSLKEKVKHLNDAKAELERQLAAAVAALVEELEAASAASSSFESATTVDSTSSTDSPSEASEDATPPPPNRRHSRQIQFGRCPQSGKKEEPPSQRLGIRHQKHESLPRLSLGNKKILARSTGPRLSQPMRHQKRPIR